MAARLWLGVGLVGLLYVVGALAVDFSLYDAFPATPLVSHEDGPAREQYNSLLQEWITSGKSKKHKLVHHSIAATAAVRKGHGLSKKTAPSTVDGEGDSIDLSSVHRECPPARCGAKATCPLSGGVCCSSGDVCCPMGSVCLTTNPPTCVTDSPTDPFRCAVEKCKANFHCPHQGVSTCCLGGTTCCPSGYKCKATFPPTCTKIVSPGELKSLQKTQVQTRKANEAKRKKRRRIIERGWKRKKEKLRKRHHKRRTQRKRQSKRKRKQRKRQKKRKRQRKKRTPRKQKRKRRKKKKKKKRRQNKRRSERTRKAKAKRLERQHKRKMAANKAKRRAFEKVQKRRTAKRRKLERMGKSRNAEKRKKARLKKQRMERFRKARRRNFNGLCILGKHCPAGFRKMGIVGFLVARRDLHKAPFLKGGFYNRDWRFVHPNLCCGAGPVSTTSKFGFFARGLRCPSGSKDSGQSGFIVDSRRYKFAARGIVGAPLNRGWRWYHPRLCVGNYKAAKTTRACMLARTCPRRFRDQGAAGLIMLKRHYKRNPFSRGGNFNRDWRWIHPRVCCL